MEEVSDSCDRVNYTDVLTVQVVGSCCWFISVRSKLGLIVIQEDQSLSNSDLFLAFDFQISSTFTNFLLWFI